MKTGAEVGAEWDRQVTRVFEETLRICEGAGVAAALVVGGEKVSTPLVTWLGYAVGFQVCLYLGVRIDTLVAYAQFRDKPRQFNWQQTTYGVVCSIVFALALVEAVKALRAIV